MNVHQAGKYEIRLRRWPEESNAAINAGMQPGEPVPGVKAYRMTPGRKFELSTATVEVSGKSLSNTFEPDAVEAVFTSELPAGKSRLFAEFHAADGSSVGAYYAYIKRIE